VSRLNEDHKEIASGKRKDDEGYMARNELDSIERSISDLRKVIKKGDTQLPAWVQSKITKAADYINTASEYLQSDEKISEQNYVMPNASKRGAYSGGDLKKSYRVGDQIPASAAKPPQKLKNNQTEEASSLVNKILEDCGCSHATCNKTPKGKMCPKHGMDDCSMKESVDPKGPVKEYKSTKEIAKKHGVSLESIEKQLKMGIKVEGEHTSDKTAAKITALQHLDEVPDYYSKLKKVEKKSTKSESVTIEDMFGNKFVEFIDLIKPEPLFSKSESLEEATRINANTGNLVSVILSWRGRNFSLKVFFPQLKFPSRKEIEAAIQKIYPDGRVLYSNICTQNTGDSFLYAGGDGGKLGPNKNYVKPMGEEVELDEDWQSVNRKDKTDGLSQKAVNAYRKENPGSKLQTAVTEKKPTGKRADRRKSFCRRMSGMKDKLTSAETARDPDSRINKALRRWNCN